MGQQEIAELIRSYGRRIDQGLQKIISKRNRSDLEKWLNEPIWYHVGSGGKRLRPALCLLTCELLGGDSEKALSFALSCEIMHNYFLLHDDVADGDTMRRDLPTVWVEYGIANAINCGDYLCAKGYESILRSDLPLEKTMRLVEIYTLTLTRTSEGQALDVNYRGCERFTVEKYLDLAKLKTGHYLVCPIVGGAIIAGASDTVVNRLWDLGDNLGTSFQIRDDIIDLSQGKGRGGEIGNDIREGKPSILYAHALSESTAKENEKLVRIMRKPREETTKEDVQWVIDFYRKHGTVEFAQCKAEELKTEALKIIDSIDFRKRDVIRDVAEYIISRQE